MNIQEALAQLLARKNLSAEDMASVMQQIMTGEATPAQIGGFLVALRMKGETVDEVAAAAEVMRSLATRVEIDETDLVDIVGTGGDQSNTFNISTTTAIVTAAAGARVAKHGNRSASSKSGSADLLEAAGVCIELEAAEVKRCIEETGIGFMFAQRHHGAMRHAIGPRREMGVRTIFNLLGPLTNPAGATRKLLGVYDLDWVRPVAEVLDKLGARHVMVVHGDGNMDEIALSGPTEVAELCDGHVTEYRIEPAEFGIDAAPLEAIQVGSPEESLARVREVLDDQEGPARDVVLLNAGAAIHVAGLADSMAAGVEKAREVLASGAARRKLAALVEVSQRLHGERDA